MHFKRLTERLRTTANAIMTAWQCGGQGFESPQLHPIEQAVLHAEGGLSRSWCRCGRHWSGGGVEAGAGVTWLYVSVVVRACAWPKHLHDDPRVHPFGRQQRGRRVPHVVEADLAYACVRE